MISGLRSRGVWAFSSSHASAPCGFTGAELHKDMPANFRKMTSPVPLKCVAVPKRRIVSLIGLTGPSKGTLVPEKDSPNTAGLSLCLQNAGGYGNLSGGFAGVHASAHRANFRPQNLSTRAQNDAHPSPKMEIQSDLSEIVARLVHHYTAQAETVYKTKGPQSPIVCPSYVAIQGRRHYIKESVSYRNFAWIFCLKSI